MTCCLTVVLVVPISLHPKNVFPLTTTFCCHWGGPMDLHPQGCSITYGQWFGVWWLSMNIICYQRRGYLNPSHWRFSYMGNLVRLGFPALCWASVCNPGQSDPNGLLLYPQSSWGFSEVASPPPWVLGFGLGQIPVLWSYSIPTGFFNQTQANYPHNDLPISRHL